VSENLVGNVLVAVGALADRVVAAPALFALTAHDGEGHDDAVADLEPLVFAADFDHLAHELMSEDVAMLHARNEAVEKMQIRAADRAGRHLDDRVARMLNPGVGNRVAANVLLAVPAQRFHRTSEVIPLQCKQRTRFAAALALAACIFLAGCAGMPENMSAPALPTSVSVPSGHRHTLTLKAAGSLNYECRPRPGMAGAYGWVLAAPDARLLHWTGLGIGRHYAGPTWSHRDGSRVSGKLVAASPAGEARLPIQLYEAVATQGDGELAGVTYIQRLNATGGEPTAPCGPSLIGRGHRVDFSADFLFYKKR
jgi:hypothetical protein